MFGQLRVSAVLGEREHVNKVKGKEGQKKVSKGKSEEDGGEMGRK